MSITKKCKIKKNVRSKRKLKKNIDSKTKKLIYRTLKKNYIHYQEKVWKKMLSVNEWEEYINQNWLDRYGNRDHGGYINPLEMKEIMGDDSVLPKELPTLKIKNKTEKINIPTCVYNLPEYQKKYIHTLRKFLLEFRGEILELDLSGNGGGKTEVIASGLLPLFLLQPSKKLTLLIGQNGHQKDGVKIVKQEISNLPVKIKTTESMKKVPERINVYLGNQTASAGEQIALSLTLLKKITEVNFIGNPTAGFTTWIEFIDLPNGGGLEYPVGNMASISGIKSRRNGKLYPQDLNR